MSCSKIGLLLGRSAKAVGSRAKVLKITKGRHPWDPREDRALRLMYPDFKTSEIARILGRATVTVYHRAHLFGMKKSAAYMASPAACLLRRDNTVGIAGRFPKGNVPANKGLRRPGWSVGRGRMQATQFKKGQRSHNWLPIGTVKMDSYGYLRRKIAATGLGGFGNSAVWEFVHRRVWEDAHGPIAEGHRIWWKDKNHENCALENLELLSDAEHMARTTIHNLHPELKQVIQLAGALKRKIGTRRRRIADAKKQDVRSA